MAVAELAVHGTWYIGLARRLVLPMCPEIDTTFPGSQRTQTARIRFVLPGGEYLESELWILRLVHQFCPGDFGGLLHRCATPMGDRDLAVYYGSLDWIWSDFDALGDRLEIRFSENGRLVRFSSHHLEGLSARSVVSAHGHSDDCVYRFGSGVAVYSVAL